MLDTLDTNKAAAESLDAKVNRVRSAFYKAFALPYDYDAPVMASSSPWVSEVFGAYVITNWGDDYWQIGYTDTAGDVTFAPRIDWTKVKPETRWVEKAKREQQRAKAGARHSASDNQMLQAIHDMANELGAECLKQVDTHGDGLFVFKEKTSGKYRWVGFSSSAFEDQDGEIVSKAALVADVARADSDSDYGPLVWWHTDAELGTTDFNAMDGPILIESGLLHNDEFGAALVACKEALGLSIRFKHPKTEPDENGIFYNIRRKERSLLPQPVASNRVAVLVGIAED